MTNWDLVGGNPAPGNADAIAAYGNSLRSLQVRVDDGSVRLTRIVGNLDTVWRDGTDATAYRASLGKSGPLFTAFSAALSAVATAADRYAEVLRAEHHTARQAVLVAERSVAAYHAEAAKPPPPLPILRPVDPNMRFDLHPAPPHASPPPFAAANH